MNAKFSVVNRQENLDYLETGENPLLLGLVLLCSDRNRREGLLGVLVGVASSVPPSSCISVTVWAGLFWQQQQLLDPAQPWLCQRLSEIYGDQWWRAETAEASILHSLCAHGPDAEALVEALQPLLNGHIALLVPGIIGAIVGQCSKEAQRLLRFFHGRENNRPVASTSSSGANCTSSQERSPATGPASFNMEEEAGMSQASLQGSDRCPQPMPKPAEWHQLQEEPEQPAVADPSAQGSICSPSAPGQGRGHSLRDCHSPYKISPINEREKDYDKAEIKPSKGQGQMEVQFVDQFGFHTVTCCGYLPQVNNWCSDWVSFFARQRIQPQMDLTGSSSGDRKARELWAQLQVQAVLSAEDTQFFCGVEIVPSLLHGDLWGGNVAEDDSGLIIFDPASFYSHSEYDLAITGMFGGFSSSFYSLYHSKIPRAARFEKRLKLYQLFHYMNH
ncbi:hypothetical protein DV515_00012215 [Chloebia gouldiae]|uniref:protein-ribulosamine 3-kinase n=1 Tax=Chloebia gouldiae TaxID=44316 RepID=A0A3L8S4E8_CHLGU|nr:hypothetical protein DV515_00012215 [Chloebia gouldiae]